VKIVQQRMWKEEDGRVKNFEQKNMEGLRRLAEKKNGKTFLGTITLLLITTPILLVR